jgi:hypothetical protein
MDGSWYYFTLDNGGIVRRFRAKALPMPDEVIARLDLITRSDGDPDKPSTSKKGKYSIFKSRWNYEQEDEIEKRLHPTMIRRFQSV